MRLYRLLLAAALFFFLGAIARADVVLTFYSHDWGTEGFDIRFPHAFIVLSGTLGNKPIKASFGFSATTVDPQMLSGQWVNGEVESYPDKYVATSLPHVSLTLNEEQYGRVMAVVDHWRTYPQPSYNFHTHDCVTFVQRVAIALQLPAADDKKFIHSPKEFLEDLQVAMSTRNIQTASSELSTVRAYSPVAGASSKNTEVVSAMARNTAAGPAATQKLNGTAAVDVLTYVGEWTPIENECGDNAGPPPLKISLRRAESAGGACEFKTIRTERGGAWRISALCSADGSSWNANIKLVAKDRSLKWTSEKGEETYYRCPN